MTLLIIQFLNSILSGLVAGTMFGIWIGYNPRNLSASTYVEQQQSVIKAHKCTYARSWIDYYYSDNNSGSAAKR